MKCKICNTQMSLQEYCQSCDSAIRENIFSDNITEIAKTKKLLCLAEEALQKYVEIPNSSIGNCAISYFNEKEAILNENS